MVSSFELLIVILFLMAVIAFLVISQHFERRMLLNRILARDLPEVVNWEMEEKRAKVPQKIIRQEGIPL